MLFTQIDRFESRKGHQTSSGRSGSDGRYERKWSISLEKRTTQFFAQRHRLAQPTFIIEARLEVGVTLSVELLTPDELWAEDDAFVVVCVDGSVSIGVDVNDR